MKRDPMMALESFYAGQRAGTDCGFDGRISNALTAECSEVDLIPVVTGFRRVLPVAAAIVFGVLTPQVSQSDVDRLANSLNRAQSGEASSVRTELETPWQD